MADKIYRDYFDIDEHYYASVTADLISKGLVSWKAFYPHETFVKLLQKTYDVLAGKEAKSLWIEGAYGTGKSHAALTLKCLLDASEEETREYFDDYGLSTDLRDKWLSIKSEDQNGKLITIHRIGSASIHSDQDLIWAVQSSVAEALKRYHIQNKAEGTMKDALLSWLEKSDANKKWLDSYLHDSRYMWSFGGRDINWVIDHLQHGDAEEVASLMRKLMTIAEDNGLTALHMDAQKLAEWIRDVIHVNSLNAIVFIWDEFTEYFTNNPNSLTGFQTLAEISESDPFYFVIVSHQSRELFVDATTATKILDRFVTPIKIELPENMAFQLMAQAMKTTDDPVLRDEWLNEYKPALNDQVSAVSKRIETETAKHSSLGRKTQLTDKEMQNIVPIHPYAALVLKHMSVIFNSNQRSMFDFIISNDVTDAKGFKWYIQNHGPLDVAENLLTVDMLWDFFYGKGQAGLSQDVRSILDNYSQLQADKLAPDEQRVLKTILLLQALCTRVSDSDLLRPNMENINLAYEGTDWPLNRAGSIAIGLRDKGILFERPVGGKTEFTVAMNTGDSGKIEKLKSDVRNRMKTTDLVEQADIMSSLDLPDNLTARFDMHLLGTGLTFTNNLGRINTIAQSQPNRFTVAVVFAQTDEEKVVAEKQIQTAVANPTYASVLFLDAALVPMGADLIEQYVNNMAYCDYYAQNDKDQSKHYNDEAERTLRQWQSNIKAGAFMIYDQKHPSGERKANYTAVQEEFERINTEKYPDGLEQLNVWANMFNRGPLALGAECGITRTEKQAFKGQNAKKRLSTVLGPVWNVDNYWEKPELASLSIVKIKKHVDEMVKKAFEESGRISVGDIYADLQNAPYGFLPVNLTAFVMGFVLREYTSNEYFWSNGTTSSPMSTDLMKGAIANAISETVNQTRDYKTEYIVAMSPEMRTFLKNTAVIFHIPEKKCGTVEQARDSIRSKMKEMTFPIWCLKSILDNNKLKTDAGTVTAIIDDYSGIANTANVSSDSESDLANNIGQLMIESPDVVDDLKELFTSEHCKEGMQAYIQEYRGGELLLLASQIHDSGAYLDEVKRKIDAEDANWVWSPKTADEKIDSVILDYRIIAESNTVLPASSTMREVIRAWNTKTSNIHISCEALENVTGDLAPFLEKLSQLSSNRVLVDQQRQSFYDLLVEQKDNFEKFYKNQVEYFKKVASAFLDDLTDENINQLYSDFPTGMFTKSKTEYFQYVEEKVDNFRKNQKKQKLRAYWMERTGTKSPADWSEIHQTPILCLLDDREIDAAKDAFRTLTTNMPSDTDVDRAMRYLENAGFYELMDDQDYIDKCFQEKIVGDYSVLLTDVNEVRRYLDDHCSVPVYDWMDNRQVADQVYRMALKKYDTGGSDRALNKINEMGVEELRRYLKKQISGNMKFGLQILTSK